MTGALYAGILRLHPFADGNHRTGFVALSTALWSLGPQCFCQGIGNTALLGRSKPVSSFNRAQPELARCLDHARVEAGDRACVLLRGQQNAAVGELDTEVCTQPREAR